MTLTSPFTLRGHVAPSRTVFGAHVTNLGDGRRFSERHVAYYARRAAGGAGIVVTEDASVHESDWPYERSPLAMADRGGWAQIADAVHAEGALVLAGLSHAGGQGSSAYSQSALWAPSRVPEVNTREVPKQMESEDVDAVIAGFAAAAVQAVDSGCDGVDVNIGQHSLVRQFLSGLTNHRGDEWAERPRLAREVLAAVRAAIGPDPLLAIRLSCDELAPWAGITPEMGAELAVDLCGDVADVDLLTVVRGSIFSVEATRPDGHTPAGFNRELVAQIGDAVRAAHADRVAIVAQGSIVDVDAAEELLGGVSDLVEMTRAQIADARLVAKVRAGEDDRVRPCVLCNQTCQVRDARNPIVTCVVDPRSGHELTDPDVEHAGPPRHEDPSSVTIVGGGVAGLEAARCLARTGHAVTLHERADRLGGALRTAAMGGGRDRLGRFADWLVADCEAEGVELVTGSSLGAERLAEIRAGGGDVVLATGSRPAEPSFRVTPKAVVLTAAQVLDDAELPAGPVLVWDPVGGPVAVSVAERLAAEGRDVVFATPDGIVGNELSRSGDLAPANARLQQAGVHIERRVTIDVARKGSVVLADRFSDRTRSIRVGCVVDCGHRLAEDALWSESSGDHRVSVVRAGDCVAPRTVLEAVLDARRAAGAVDGLGSVSDGVPMGVLGGAGGH